MGHNSKYHDLRLFIYVTIVFTLMHIVPIIKFVIVKRKLVFKLWLIYTFLSLLNVIKRESDFVECHLFAVCNRRAPR